MKPIQIVLHNIGPFRNETLDFTQLDAMFLIYGNTGSGKTTIFDAMTYALYGTLNGTRKGSVRAFRSDFATPEELSFVEFTFELAYVTYRITRTLPQTYTTRNGTAGEKAVTVSLETSTDGTSFIPFSGTAGETNSRIEGIVGLSGTEFSRIVLLPQGAFAEFLHENSKDRRDTLEKLFPVDSYTALIEEVKSLSDENTKQLEAVSSQILRCSEKYNAQTAPGELSSLAAQQLELAKTQEHLIRSMTDLSASREKLRAQYTAAQQTEYNRKRLAELLNREQEIEDQRKQLARAAEAASLSGYIQNMVRTKETVRHCTETVAEAKQNAETIAEELLRLTNEADRYEQLKKEAEDADAILPMQKKRLAQIQQLTTLRAAAARTAEAERASAAGLQAAEAEAAGTASQLLKTAQTVCPDADAGMSTAHVLTLLSGAEQSARTALTLAQTDAKNARCRAELAEETAAAIQTTARCAPAYEQSRRNVENSKKWISELELQRDEQNKNNAACILASDLADGQPCPVCGSTVHPSPAEPLPELLDLDTKIATARNNLSLAEHDAEVKLSENARAQKHLEELQEQLAAAPEAPSEAEAGQALSAAESVYKTVSETSAACARYAETHQQLEQQIRTLSQHASAVKSEAAFSRAAYEQLAQSVRGSTGEDIPDGQALSADIAALEQRSAENKRAYTLWNTAFTEAGKKNSSAQTRFEELSVQLETAVRNEADASDSLVHSLSATSFKTPEEAQSALLSDEVQEKLERTVESYDDERRKITAVLENAPQTDTCASLTEQLGQLESELIRTKTELEQTGKKLQDVNTSYAALQSLISESAALEKERLELEQKAAPYKMLFNDLSGRNPKNIPFNSWALGIYFERIVEYANSRFFSISGGRFLFKLASDRNQGGGFKGLDLVVSDTFTGTDRDTATLSGGETFMASISLALALTDIVQSRNGGVHLDSLFIDEGFGSLDEETLDCAVTVLNNLQETKKVGIISHVESMKTAIPSQIEIIKTAEGSHITVH